MKKIYRLSLIAAAVILSGCAATKGDSGFQTPNLPSPRDINYPMKDQFENWDSPAIEYSGEQVVSITAPMPIPLSILSKKVDISFNNGASVEDLVQTLSGFYKLPVLTTDKNLQKRVFQMSNFKGELGDLLTAVSNATNVFFTWKDGFINISPKETFMVAIPQDEELTKKITAGLKELLTSKSGSSGSAATNNSSQTIDVADNEINAPLVSTEAGLVTFAATPAEYKRIKSFLTRVTNNAAVINFQLAVIIVKLNQDAGYGIDWSKFTFGAGKDYTGNTFLKTGSQPGYVPPASTTGTTTGTTGTGTATATTPSAAAGAAASALIAPFDAIQGGGALATFSQLNAGGYFVSKFFNIGALFKFLQRYGVTETNQNLVLKTIGNNPVQLNSTTMTPYVSQIDVTNLVGGGATSSNSGIKTDKAEDGLKVKLTPQYDADAKTVSVGIDINVKSLLGMTDLSAGVSIGKLTQPITADRSFNNRVRIRPGETVIVGGMIYNSISNDSERPNFVSGNSLLNSSDMKVDRNALVVVLRPTITMLGKVEERDETGKEVSRDKPVFTKTPLLIKE